MEAHSDGFVRGLQLLEHRISEARLALTRDPAHISISEPDWDTQMILPVARSRVFWVFGWSWCSALPSVFGFRFCFGVGVLPPSYQRDKGVSLGRGAEVRPERPLDRV